MFRAFQIIIREFRLSLLKLLHIHDLLRFCKQGFGCGSISCCVGICCRECIWLGVRRMLRTIRRTYSQIHSLQQIPTQHDMLPQHLVYKNEVNREYVITLARKDETP